VTRNRSIDVYRGFVMLLMMMEVLRLSQLAQTFPGERWAEWIAFHQSHVAWEGGSLHDMIQPSFSFLVGVALPYSVASRLAKGAAMGELWRHALVRSLVLVLLGVFLRSTHRTQTYFTFEDTLSQIGLGYPLLFWLGRMRERAQWWAFTVIVVGYWAAWMFWPIAGLPWELRWAKPDGTIENLSTLFDVWFLNLFPREQPWTYHKGGYGTLNFIPTLATMLLGAIAGAWLRATTTHSPAGQAKLLRAGGILFVLGLGAHFTGLCPIVKRIWSPAWVLASGGVCFAMLAGFRYLIDLRGWMRWARLLEVIGLNSIAAYLIAHLWEDFFLTSLRIHLGAYLPGEAWMRFVTLALMVAVLFWMERRRLYLKV
jgi:predicted acyltransferase